MHTFVIAGQGHLRGVYVFGTVDLFKVVDAIVVSTNVPGGNEMARSFGPISPAMMRSRGPGCGGTFGAPPGLRPSLSSYSSNAGSRTNTSYQHFWSVPSTPNLSQCDDVKTFAQVPLHAESKSGLATPSDSLMQAINLNSLVNASLFSNVGPCSTLHNAAEVSRVDLTKAKCDTVRKCLVCKGSIKQCHERGCLHKMFSRLNQCARSCLACSLWMKHNRFAR